MTNASNRQSKFEEANVRLRVLMLIGVALLLGAGVAACTSSDTKDLEDRLDAVEAQQAAVQDIQDQLQLTAMRSALDTLDGAGLHAIDEAANEEGTVDAGASGGVSRAIMAVAATTWPDELQATAGELVATLQELHEALDTADAAVVGPAATAAHDAQHDFSEEARTYISEAVGLPVEEHEEGGETPAAETPAAEETTAEQGG